MNDIISKNNVVKDKFSNIPQNESNNIEKENLENQNMPSQINTKIKDIFGN